MKKKYLAALLSATIAFSSMPAVPIFANPIHTETETENSSVTEESETASSDLEENAVEEPANNETLEETEAPSTETISESEPLLSEAETTSEEMTTEYESVFETTETDSISKEPEDTYFTEESIEENMETSLSESDSSCEDKETSEEPILVLDDSITIPFSYNDSKVTTNFISANSSSFESELFSEEMVTGVPYVELYTLIQNENAFRAQLSDDFELKLFDAGKKTIIEQGYKYILLEGIPELHNTWEEICNVFSALAATYPNKFNWMNWTNASFGRKVYYYKESKTYSYKYTLVHSPHYTASLETKANKKVTSLVTEATTYAKEHYPESPAYGMIAYFNNWLCENSYFEREHGMSDEASVQKGKIYYYSHTCYGPLLFGYGTSEGYALAMARLLDAAGIRNLYVTGSYQGDDPYSEYAWNYIEMPNGYWYLVDTIRNDIECDDIETNDDYEYLLIQPDDLYQSDSRKWKTIAGSEVEKRLDYESLINAASEDYFSHTSENKQLDTLALNTKSIVLKPGQKFQLSLTDSSNQNSGYYEKFVKTWSSNNTRIAKINKTGLITAGTVPGKAVISVETANRIINCDVYVYQFTNIVFDDNNKTKYTATYANADTSFNDEDIQTLTLTVNQKNPQISAEEVVSGNNLNEAIAKSNKPAIAKVESVTLDGDTITLEVLPKSIGTAQITITLAGKKAYYTIKITQDLQENWFDFSNIPDTVIYNGKNFKPTIPLTESGRDCSPKATYKITYTNCKNASESDEAVITIKGTGKYSGTLTKTFTILPKDLSTAVFRSCTSSKTYNTKALAPATSIKLEKTTLKAGRDYKLTYSYTDSLTGTAVVSDTAPTEAGTYKVNIVGTGNYKGTLPISQTKTYTIKPASINSMRITHKTTIKYTGKPENPLKSVKLGNQILPSQNYKVTYLNSSDTEISAPVEKGKYTLVVTPIGNNIKSSLTRTCIKKIFTIK